LKEKPMPDLKKVRKKADKAIFPLNGIDAFQYVSPFGDQTATRKSKAREANEGFFELLQQTAKGTSKSLNREAAAIVRDQAVIQGNMDAIKQNFKDLEKPFKKNDNTALISALSNNVSAAIGFWKDVVKELEK
jgi:hypothetical protein